MNYLQRKKKIFQSTNRSQIIKQGKLQVDYDKILTKYYLRYDGMFIMSGSMIVYAIIIPKNAKKISIDNGNKNIASSNIHSIGVGINFENNATVLGTSKTNYIEIEIKEDYIGKMFFISVDNYKCDISNCIFEITG